MKLARMIIDKSYKLYKKNILKDEFLNALDRWYKDRGDQSLRIDYKLNESSIVLDVGGFKGGFTEKITEKFKCNVHVFEPVETYYRFLMSKFNDNQRVIVHSFGLGGKDSKERVNIQNDASSIFSKHKDADTETIQLRDVYNFLLQNNIESIDLLKINIEGGEFDLLERIIEMNLQSKIKNFQIQFHTFVPNAESRRQAIREELSKTHKIDYDYYFVWESWSLK